MAEVVLDNVTKIYPGNVAAVSEVSLTINDGELLVLVGPSGCGKTTTLRLIAGLESITRGTVRIGDRIVNNVQPKDRDIAMVFQNYALYPHMTAYKNMAFGLKMRKVPKDEIDRRVRETSDMLGITELLNRKPRAMSGGQRQRVAVGRAIVRDPRCYLFDEPLSNLDAKLRAQMRAELKHLHLRLNTTTIHVTHDQEEAMTLSDRVAVMSRGKIQQLGPPMEVYRRPANRFVAGFLGTPTMNFADGHVRRDDGRLWFDDGRGLRLVLANDLAHAAEASVDQPLVLGVRPDALQPCASGGAPNGSTIDLKVIVTEPLGDRMDVYARTGADTTMIARISADVSIEAGQSASFHVDPGAVHLFEPGEFGRHLVHG